MLEDKAMKKKLTISILAAAAFLVILTFTGTVSAQSPPCSNKWMEIGPNILTAGPMLKVGRHKMWVGKKNNKTGMIENWTSYGPFKMAGGTKYLLRIESTGIVGPTANDASLGQYSNPSSDRATIYFQNKAGSGVWVAACTQFTGS